MEKGKAGMREKQEQMRKRMKEWRDRTDFARARIAHGLPPSITEEECENVIKRSLTLADIVILASIF